MLEKTNQNTLNKDDIGEVRDEMKFVRFVNLLTAVCLGLFCFLTFLIPYSRAVVIYCLFIVWFGTSLMIDSRWLDSKKVLVFSVFFYLLVLAIESLAGMKIDPLYAFFQSNIYFFMWMFIGVFYLSHDKLFQVNTMLKILLIALLISYIATIVGLIEYPMASRDLASPTNPNNALYASMGIGGFSHIYMMAALLILSVNIIGLNRRWYINFIAVGSIILMVVVTFKADYTTALLLNMLALVVAIILKGEKRISLKLIIMCFAGFICLLFLRGILEWGIVFFEDSTTIPMRLQQLYDALYYGDVDDLQRIELLSQSWNCFLQNPIFGNMLQIGTSGSLGGHSEVFDRLGAYGLFSAPYFMIYISTFVYQYKSLYTMTSRYSYVLACAFLLILSIMNPILVSSVLSAVVFFFVPMVLKNTERRKKNKEFIEDNVMLDKV